MARSDHAVQVRSSIQTLTRRWPRARRLNMATIVLAGNHCLTAPPNPALNCGFHQTVNRCGPHRRSGETIIFSAFRLRSAAVPCRRLSRAIVRCICTTSGWLPGAANRMVLPAKGTSSARVRPCRVGPQLSRSAECDRGAQLKSVGIVRSRGQQQLVRNPPAIRSTSSTSRALRGVSGKR